MATATREMSVPLQEWANANQPQNGPMFAQGYWDQITFVRDKIARALAKNPEEYKIIQAKMRVISTHTSQAVLLPVFSLELDNGITFTLQYNFYKWRVSVNSPRSVTAGFMGLFNPEERVDPVTCEGFPEELIYGSYNEDNTRFTFELPPENYHIFTFFWIFAHQVLGVKKRNK